MAILATKLKNALKAKQGDLEFRLKNIRINGSSRGCSGHIRDTRTGHVVYISTEQDSIPGYRCLVRTARDMKDYTGGHNFFMSPDNLVGAILDMLSDHHDHMTLLGE